MSVCMSVCLYVYICLSFSSFWYIMKVHVYINRPFPRRMRSQGKRPGCGSRQACRPRRHFRAFLFRKETLMGHYFIFKFDLSWGIRTNMGKLEGVFLNLQCDCHRVASIFIKLMNQRINFITWLPDLTALGINGVSLNSQAHIFSILRTGLINKLLQSYQIEENIERYTFGNSDILSCP